MNQAAEMVSEVEVTGTQKSTFMQRVWKKMGKEEKGFTLIELLAVLVIIAIIAVIAIPLIGNIISNSRSGADVATGRQVYDASRLYITGEENGKFFTPADGKTAAVGATVDISDMQEKGYLDSPLSLPSTKKEITEGTVTYTGTGSLDKVTLTTEDGEQTISAKQILSQTK
ncbi:prepilin-type N-terminal cleavage/methylation domain-containing protein [Saccharibacillus sp. CPCC 101409]|uniref:prepilin-type N-terminal cleavage/methylation domain-containing protein n=1 Tax=Saccharibacillus sp. CPCC 101409 TaxID=3058041 RepID=UPI002673A69E|nr:prepilin-type N-terminal cleavage/methylation domain-containing protein [Saccharibacillus sp. CPCC 101409]MDO3412045.1 prepilin-type N-terminal cleavage/methylation domain-containing protein [Saccharibacillus sp. CPCC 101409]